MSEISVVWSHPSRVRGLKHVSRRHLCSIVAPFTGAWIETSTSPRSRYVDKVAPFTGAWIETIDSSRASINGIVVAPFTGAWIETRASHVDMYSSAEVAPFTGAWIETLPLPPLLFVPLLSHPSRVRGLKPHRNGDNVRIAVSHPSRVRGLKPAYDVTRGMRRIVAPFTGAWIETIRNRAIEYPAPVAPFTGAWIETQR